MRRNIISGIVGFVALVALAVPTRAQTGLPMPIDVDRDVNCAAGS